MKKREYLVALFATVFLMIVIDRLCLIFEFYYWISQSFWRTGIFRWYDHFFPVHTLIYAIISSYLGIFLTFGIILKTEYKWNLKKIFFVAILTSVLFTISNRFLIDFYPHYLNLERFWSAISYTDIFWWIGYLGTTFLFSLLGNIIGFFFIGYENKMMPTPKPK